mmetsp:Transcript_1432/g.4899  ORF Transcript_1432/g.4899 Transcript_1432/m.4899 type:complete len:264 (+) Transcript_1432:63-854(+)|eukprot:CAMPEP_0117449404 /NCGR_PEP_ID=MMETSP0759-20121206/7929_1 /TAXON_ID=63605 /ORGANISM="Percolomonas cosmopolitus, Strain WS" /LENGTH=263 /DNA_ID=CAMNT_0005241881 /DNA_START=64 /DNA_END=855 /DNA_ORIENTATION=+
MGCGASSSASYIHRDRDVNKDDSAPYENLQTHFIKQHGGISDSTPSISSMTVEVAKSKLILGEYIEENDRENISHTEEKNDHKADTTGNEMENVITNDTPPVQTVPAIKVSAPLRGSEQQETAPVGESEGLEEKTVLQDVPQKADAKANSASAETSSNRGMDSGESPPKVDAFSENQSKGTSQSAASTKSSPHNGDTTTTLQEQFPTMDSATQSQQDGKSPTEEDEDSAFQAYLQEAQMAQASLRRIEESIEQGDVGAVLSHI